MEPLKLYSHPNISSHLVARDEAGGWWLVPAAQNGWAMRSPYRGPTAHLDPYPPEWTPERMALR